MKREDPEEPHSAEYGDRLPIGHAPAIAINPVTSELVQPPAREHDPTREGTKAEYVAPRTSTEAAIAQIWADVLRRERIGLLDDFFELGGDSLRAVQAIARIANVLGVEMSIYDFFERPTLRDVARRATAPADFECPIPRTNRTSSVPLSWAQQRLWFIHQFEGGSRAYNIAICVRLIGPLDQSALRAALDGLVDRHEVLRTIFIILNGELVQAVVGETRFALRVVTLSALGAEQNEAMLRSHVLEEVTAPFDFAAHPPIRGRLLKLSECEHVLVIAMHHIVSDGWSVGILNRDLGVLYEAHVTGRAACLPKLSIQYADYAHWQREWLTGAKLQEQLTFWKDHLRGAPHLLELPTDRPRPSARSYIGASANISLGIELTHSLKALSRSLNLTLAMIMYSAWSIVLSRLSGQDDIVVGVPVANRRRTELEDLIGFFVNTLALRVRMQDDPKIVELLSQVKKDMLAAYAHQDIPLTKVVEEIQPPRTPSYNPLFQVMFVFQNAPVTALDLARLRVREEEVPVVTAQFDLLLSLQETPDGITGTLNYSRDLFDGSTIERWVDYLKAVLIGIVQNPQLKVSKVPLVGSDNVFPSAEPIGEGAATFGRDILLHELFEERVNKQPNAPAAVYEEACLTYSELNARANQLAWHLRSKAIGPDKLVGICVDRGLDMVVAMLAVLKAGGAYVPLDPAYPPDRLAYMLKDAAPTVVLIQEKFRDRLARTDATIVLLDHSWDEIARNSSRNLDASTVEQNSRQLAYVIYTSGSTGDPKGVMVEHRNVTRLFQATEEWFDFNERDVWTLFHSFAFDFSVWELWGALLYGGRVVVVPAMTARSPELFYRLVCACGVTVLNQTPSAFRQLAQAQAQSHAMNPRTSLRVIIFGGEALDLSGLRPWLERNGAERPRMVNMYGITETTVHVTYHPISAEEIRSETRNVVGAAIPDLTVYLLDPHRQRVPIDAVGEIYVRGSGVARGYLNQPALTAERFLPDPFGGEPQSRMYKTGDMGRWRSDGSLEYLGRNDHQVKVRGFRVELGEIEAQLVRYPQVKDAVVIAREDVAGEKYLAAYVIPEQSIDTQAHRAPEMWSAHLKAVLPEHMVPRAYVILDRFPLTVNGKMDRRSLPAPGHGAYLKRQYEAPRDRIEVVLAEIWQHLLGVERVGRWDNFFELGGHSLMIVKLMDRLRRVGLTTEVRHVFGTPVLAEFAKVLTTERLDQVQVPPNLIPQGCEEISPEMLPLVELNTAQIKQVVQSVPGGAANIQDIYPLAPLQEGLLFHHLLNAQYGDTYLVPILLSVSSRGRLEELIAALQEASDRHEVLRTAILWEELPRPVQVVHRRSVLPVAEIALDRYKDATTQVLEWIKPELQRIDLRQAPLMRLQVAEDMHSGQWYAMILLHHMICDNASREMLISEVVARLGGRPHRIVGAESYRCHVAQVLAYARTHDAEEFFRRKLADISEPTAPFGLLDVHGDGSQIKDAREELDPALGQRLRTVARRMGVTEATLFHAAWSLVVARTSGRVEAVFGTVLLGRLQGAAGAQQILGMFINTLPLRLRLHDVTCKELIERTQRELAELVAHEHCSLAVAQRCSGIVGKAPLFSALINYRHSVPNPDAEWATATGIEVLASQERTNYPIVLSVDDLGRGFRLTAQTDRRVDPSRVIRYVERALGSIIEALERAPHTSALSLAVLPETERQQVINLFNATLSAYSTTTLIHELFERQVERTPGAMALMCEDRSLTYAELNHRANQLARHLRRKGVGPDDLVAICANRSLELVVGVLGILKAGGAYVPLDPAYPSERLMEMLNDSRPKIIVLTHDQLQEKLPCTGADVVALDTHWKEIARYPGNNLEAKAVGLDSRHLAYVIYTSGSTGRPKGVAIEHRSTVNLICWASEGLDRRVFDQTLHSTSLNFDLSVYECFVPLAIGATVRIVESVLALVEAQSGVTLINSVPSAIKTLLESGAIPETTRVVNLAGEPLKKELVDQIFSSSLVERVSNLYGPSETTTYSTCISMRREDGFLSTIGRPIANTQLYVLDPCQQAVPIGVVGEICIGGAGVARGYLNRPELTAASFVVDPFSLTPHARMYKTGDLGRWLDDGNIEFLGRNDHQVKIRGFRIEPKEVEAQLGRHEQVEEVAVIAREDVPGERRLVAYVIPCRASGTKSYLTVEVLRTHAAAVLPQHMVPNAIVILDHFPLTPNGKLDRRALPPPELRDYPAGVYEAPLGQTEEILAEIWQGLLRVQRIGRHDNFFELGGDSLLAMQLMVRIRSSLSVDIPIRSLFQRQTLLQLSADVETLRDAALVNKLTQGGTNMTELLARVESMPDGTLEEMLRQLKTGAWQ